jgi:addiction module HigA family antidote
MATKSYATRQRPPIPPGEILLEEFMKPHNVSQNRLARDIDINPARINDIVHGRSAITAPVALRLAKYFGTTPELWMNLQSGYACCARPARPNGQRSSRGCAFWQRSDAPPAVLQCVAAVCSPHGAKRNAGAGAASEKVPDFAGAPSGLRLLDSAIHVEAQH